MLEQEIEEFWDSFHEKESSLEKRTTTSSPKRREHNHFPQGKMSYVPQGTGVNPYSEQGRAYWERFKKKK